MAHRNLIFSLAKVIIAAAWADGELTLEETNSLKDLLFRLPRSSDREDRHLTNEEWALLDMYLESPVSPKERERLVDELRAALHTSADREIVLNALDDLVNADGVISDEERAVVAEVTAAIANVNLSILGQLGRLVNSALNRRAEVMTTAPNRERYFDDFIRNKVFYGVRRRLDLGTLDLDLPEPELRWLAAIGGLLARVAHVDRTVTDDEFNAIADLLQKSGRMSREEAAIVAEVAVSEIGADMDLLRLTRELYTSMTPEEGTQILELLFAVAASDGLATTAEMDTIYTISRNLGLTHRQFIEAKLQIPASQRES